MSTGLLFGDQAAVMDVISTAVNVVTAVPVTSGDPGRRLRERTTRGQGR